MITMITRTGWRAVGMLCLALWSTAYAQPPPWQNYMDAGLRAYQQGRHAEAQRAFESAIEQAERLGAHNLRLASSLTGLALVYHV